MVEVVGFFCLFTFEAGSRVSQASFILITSLASDDYEFLILLPPAASAGATGMGLLIIIIIVVVIILLFKHFART